MKKLYLLIAISLLSFNAFAVNIIDAFHSMPDSLLVQFRAEQKSKLIEGFLSNYTIENNYKGKSYIDSISIESNFLQIKTTDISTLQIKVLKKENDTIIGVISTICDEFCDSKLQFYSQTWQPLSQQIEIPSVDNFFYLEKMNDDEKVMLLNSKFLPFYRISFIENGIEINFSGFDSFDFLDKEKLKDFLHPVVINK